MPAPRGREARTTCRRKRWGLRDGCGAMPFSAPLVGEHAMTSLNGTSGEGRRKPAAPHRRRLSTNDRHVREFRFRPLGPVASPQGLDLPDDLAPLVEASLLDCMKRHGRDQRAAVDTELGTRLLPSLWAVRFVTRIPRFATRNLSWSWTGNGCSNFVLRIGHECLGNCLRIHCFRRQHSFGGGDHARQPVPLRKRPVNGGTGREAAAMDLRGRTGVRLGSAA